MLHGQARLIVQDGKACTEAANLAFEKLSDGDYTVLIFDDAKNRSLPQLKYLFGVVLKEISEKLPTHPPVDALYRYFEVFKLLASWKITGMYRSVNLFKVPV